MIILLNGPLGTGKSTLAEALSERMKRCVMLDGDRLVAANPPASDELEHLHSTIALLVAHHRSFGYLHFVIDHIWTSPAQLTDLRTRSAGRESSAGAGRTLRRVGITAGPGREDAASPWAALTSVSGEIVLSRSTIPGSRLICTGRAWRRCMTTDQLENAAARLVGEVRWRVHV
jgi:hypothetical protein